jgi:tRNA-dihydrouridine synthase B
MKKRYTLEQKRWDSPAGHAMPEHTRVPASFTIGNVKIAPATVLAPMAGVTDTVFRRFIKNASMFSAASTSSDVEATQTNQQSGCGLIMTEFTSADGLSRMRETKRKRYLTYYDDEHPISAQLFGSNPETLADSARIVQDAGFDLVDLNLGCPAKRVVACNGGSGLLRDLPRSPSPSPSSSAWAGTTNTLSASTSRKWPKTAASTPAPSTPAPAKTATPAKLAGSTSPLSKTL